MERHQKGARTLGEAFEEFRQICAEEQGYTLEIPPRQERPNPFLDVLDELDRFCEFVWRRIRVIHRIDVVADVQRDDVGAVGCQPDRMCAALPTRGPGDEGDFAFEISHGQLLPVGCSVVLPV